MFFPRPATIKRGCLKKETDHGDHSTWDTAAPTRKQNATWDSWETARALGSTYKKCGKTWYPLNNISTFMVGFPSMLVYRRVSWTYFSMSATWGRNMVLTMSAVYVNKAATTADLSFDDVMREQLSIIGTVCRGVIRNGVPLYSYYTPATFFGIGI